MVAFIDDHRDRFGVEPICQLFPIAPSTYYRYKQLEREPERRSTRAKQDERLKSDIERVWQENNRNYGVRKVWKQLHRKSIVVARCTVERLMRQLGLEGVKRGKRWVTSIPGDQTDKPLDLVNRQYAASRPNQLWVADITYVASWTGFVYVAFVIDVFSRRIVGWRLLKYMQIDLVLDALEQALWQRGKPKGVTHHGDRASQYLSIRHTKKLAEAGFNASVGSVDDSYDNALAESINGFYKAEVIHKDGPWRGWEDVERATLIWVDWFNNQRLLEPLGDIPPEVYEDNYYRQTKPAQAA